MKNYMQYIKIDKEVLDTLQVGDLVKINDWGKPMRVKGVTKNYVALSMKQFKDTIYSIVSKIPWGKLGMRHNAMTGGCFHCGRDNWIFGAPDFNYNFDDAEAVQKYLESFETGETEISERAGVPIRKIAIKYIGTMEVKEGQK